MLGVLVPAGYAGAETLDDVRSEVAYDNDTAAVLRLYRAFLDREPEADGARYWVEQSDAGVSLDDIAWAFAASDEFTMTYGEELTDEQFLTIVYGNVLGRDPDAEGLAYWLDLMENGLARPAVVRWITANAEFINTYPYEPLGPGYSGPGGFSLGRMVADDGSANLVRLDMSTAVGKLLLVEASSYDRPVLHPAGRVAYMSQSAAQTCPDGASAQPVLWEIEMGTGALTMVGNGTRPQVSPDGRHLAFLRGDDCESTADEVLATVVVRDLLTGIEQVLSPDLDTAITAGALAWVDPDTLRFGTWSIDLTGTSSFAATAWTLPVTDVPLGVVDGAIVVESVGDDTVDLVSIDPETGDRTVLGSEPVEDDPAWAVDVNGSPIVVSGELIRPHDSLPYLGRPEGLDWLDW